MPLINKIKARVFNDLINEGSRVSLTGTVSAGTDQVVFAATADRAFVITGVVLSTDSAAANLVSVGLKQGTDATLNAVQAHITSGSMLNKTYAIGDWIYGDLNYNVVISAALSSVTYTIDGRVISSPTPLGYVFHS